MLEDWKSHRLKRWEDEETFAMVHGKTMEEAEREIEKIRLACGPGMEGILSP